MPFRFAADSASSDVEFTAWGATLEEIFISSATALLQTMTAVPELVLCQQKLVVRLEHIELDLLLFGFCRS